MIAPALQALTAHRQFICYRLEQSKTRPGKLDKIPCNYQTGVTASAHDPVNWTDYESAKAAAARLGTSYGVGFVLTSNCQRFCIDLDECLQPDGQLSPIAKELCSMFPGAAIEVSQSGRGLHIYGSYIGPEPTHGCKNIALGIELYTSGRFIALGRPNSATGSAATDCTLELHCVIELYFKSTTTQDVPIQEWTTEPCPEWSGPTDDDVLIQRAIRSQSVNKAFSGTKASFADLWNANGPALARTYRDTSGTREYDCSSADAALAQHLAFWTGKDCERIRRLMERSHLKRDKWERPDYLPRTISAAVARQIDVLQDKPNVDEASRRRAQIEESMRIGDGSDEIPLAGTVALDEMLTRFVFVQDGQQVVDLSRPRQVAVMSDWKASLRASTTTREVKGQFNYDGTAKLRIYETATLWEKSPERQQAFGVTFKAGGPLFIRDPKGADAVNIWAPFDRSVTPGDASIFLEHVNYLFGRDAERVLDWLAHIEQKPGELPHSGWVHISEEHGTGRNWLAGLFARVWPGYAAVNFDLSGTLRTGFNGRLSSKLIAVVDEIQEGGRNAKWENAEKLKSLVTEEYRTINPKFGRERIEFNACRWLIFSNHIDALPLESSDRRFNVVRNEKAPRDVNYYKRLYAALKDHSSIAGVAHFFRNRDLSNFNPGAHAVMNEAKEALVAASRGEADEALDDLVKRWPVDIIATSVLGELITGQPGGRLTNGHRHALERQGIKRYGRKIRIGETPMRVHILRNYPRWKDADAGEIRAEFELGPKLPFAGVRAYLESLDEE